MGFLLPAVLIAIMSFMTFLFTRNSPEDVGLSPLLDTQDATSGDTELITFKYVFRKVFSNPITITIAIAEFCTGFVRHGFEQWFPRYMQEAQNLKLDSAIFQTGAFGVVIAGILGAFAAGTIFTETGCLIQEEHRVAFIGYFLQILCLAVIWQIKDINLIIVAFIVNSAAISMVHSMLSGTASMDFGGKRAAATATGMFDGMQYLGGAALVLESDIFWIILAGIPGDRV